MGWLNTTIYIQEDTQEITLKGGFLLIEGLFPNKEQIRDILLCCSGEKTFLKHNSGKEMYLWPILFFFQSK